MKIFGNPSHFFPFPQDVYPPMIGDKGFYDEKSYFIMLLKLF
jgi:hypothetical protein